MPITTSPKKKKNLRVTNAHLIFLCAIMKFIAINVILWIKENT